MDASRSLTRIPTYRNFVFIFSKVARELGEISDAPSLADRARFARVCDIGFLPESRDVEARVLFRGADPDRAEDVDDPQEDVGPAEREGRDNHTSEGLDRHLTGVAEEEAIPAGQVDLSRCEETRCDGAPDPADAMASEHIERIVEGGPGPPASDIVAQNPRHQADDDRRHRADVSGGGRDGNEAADRAHRDARGRMDDHAAREVNDPEGLQPTTDAPVPMGDGHVDERRPRDDVDHEGLEPDALGEGTDDEGRRDRRELQLEREVEELGNRARVPEVRRRAYVVQPEIGEVSNEPVEGRP